MCNIGDIIIIEDPKYHNKKIGKHSFVVISDKKGVIKSMEFDFISLIMSSFKNEEQKQRKLSYPGNLYIGAEERDMLPDVEGINNKDGYIKCEQFFYFNENSIEYNKIGSLKEDVIDKIFDYIENDMNIEIERLTENLKNLY